MGRVIQAADESNIPFLASALTFGGLLAAVPFILLLLVGLSLLVQAVADAQSVDPIWFVHRFLPPHDPAPGRDPFALVEGLLAQITRNRGELSLFAAPAFIWFSTRLFAGIRVSLNDIYDVAVRPPRQQHFLLSLLLAKLRDIGMVIAVVILILANSLLTVGLALVQARGAAALPAQFDFFVSTLGRILAEGLTLLFAVSLFYVVYRYASVRRLPRVTALLASLFTAVLFELAKRLYGFYLANFATVRVPAGDANIGAAVLFVLWVYYTAIVFLLGAVVAETWELRKMQRRQRAILS